MRLRRFLKLSILSIAALFVFAVLALAALIVYDSVFPRVRVSEVANLSYSGPEGRELQAYLARPQGTGPFPAVVMVHEFFGLRPEDREKANLLAEEGYVVLAPDLYRGKTTGLVPRAIWLVLTTPQDEIDADLDAAYAYLSRLEGVDPGRIGAVGFCFGGSQTLRLGIRNPELAANVILYGSDLVADPGALGNLGQNGPVLGIFGEQDRSIPLEEVQAFETAMQARGLDSQVTVYPGVGHAFVNTQAIAAPGPAQEAWEQIKQFLRQALG